MKCKKCGTRVVRYINSLRNPSCQYTCPKCGILNLEDIDFEEDKIIDNPTKDVIDSSINEFNVLPDIEAKESWEKYRRETAAKILTAVVNHSGRNSINEAASFAVKVTDRLIDELKGKL